MSRPAWPCKFYKASGSINFSKHDIPTFHLERLSSLIDVGVCLEFLKKPCSVGPHLCMHTHLFCFFIICSEVFASLFKSASIQAAIIWRVRWEFWHQEKQMFIVIWRYNERKCKQNKMLWVTMNHWPWDAVFFIAFYSSYLTPFTPISTADWNLTPLILL